MSRIWLINFFASTPATGIGGRHHHLGRELARMGHEVTVVAARRHHVLREGIDTAALPAEEMTDGYRFLRIDVPAYAHAHDKRRVLAGLVFSARLAGLRRRLGGRPDAVLCSSPDLLSYLGAERLARGCGARLVFEVRDIWPLTLVEIGGYSPRHPFIRFLQWIEDRAYARADRVVSNLEGAVEHMAARGMDRGKFTWVSNGIALDEVAAPAPLPPEVAQQIPADGLRIVYTGTLGTANALDTLIEAAALLRDLPDVHILLVGQGRARVELEARRDALGLTNVRFLGAVPKPQVQSVLAACDVCVISQIRTPLYRFGISPNKIFEYLSAGRPILTLYSGRYDIVSRYNAGIRVAAENPKACAQAIRTLKDMSAEERSELGRNGKLAAFEDLNYRVLAEKLETALVPDNLRLNPKVKRRGSK